MAHLLAIAALGVNEEQARGALHMHLLFFGGLPPRLLRIAARHPNLRNTASEIINKMVSAELDDQTHIQHLLDELSSTRRPRSALYAPHDPKINEGNKK